MRDNMQGLPPSCTWLLRACAAATGAVHQHGGQTAVAGWPTQGGATSAQQGHSMGAACKPHHLQHTPWRQSKRAVRGMWSS